MLIELRLHEQQLMDVDLGPSHSAISTMGHHFELSSVSKKQHCDNCSEVIWIALQGSYVCKGLYISYVYIFTAAYFTMIAGGANDLFKMFISINEELILKLIIMKCMFFAYLIDCSFLCHKKCVEHIRRVCAHIVASEKGELEMLVCPEKGLSSQSYKCAECKTNLSFGKHINDLLFIIF